MRELERTFLVRFLPSLEKCEFREIIDHYIPVSAEHPTVRVRKDGSRFEITKKQPLSGDSSEQEEQTISLTEEEFIALINIPGRRLRKIRYFLDNAQIDVFQDGLSGLVLADFEFATPEEKSAFAPPEFCLTDVTQESFIAGGLLAGKSYQDIERRLESLGYAKI